MISVPSSPTDVALQASIAVSRVPARSASPHAFFQAIASLPSLNYAFHDHAHALIDSQGKEAWEAAGGRPGVNDLLEYGDQSEIGAKIVADAIRQYGGFHYTDQARLQWAYRVPGLAQSEGPWDALALCGDCLIDSVGGYVDRINRRELREEFVRRHVHRAKSIGKQIENRGRITDLLEKIRLWRRAPRLVPTLYNTAVTEGPREFHVPRDMLAGELFDPSRRWPYDWEQQLERALGVLSSIEIYQVKLARTGWNPCVVGLLPAIAELDCNGDEILIRLAQEFVKFLDPCFPADSPSFSPSLETDQAKPTSHKLLRQNMESPEEKSATEPAGSPPQTDDGLQRQVQIVEKALPAVHMATIAGKSLKQEVSVLGYLEYLSRLLAASGNPADPIERMMCEQLAFAHCRIGQLHANAACATSAQLEVAYTLAAAKLMAESRKTSLALKEYRTASLPKVSGTPAAPDTNLVESEPLPQPPTATAEPSEIIGDTELTTNGSMHDRGKRTHASAGRGSSKPGASQGIDTQRPSKASRDGNRLSALATLNGSANGRGKGPFRG